MIENRIDGYLDTLDVGRGFNVHTCTGMGKNQRFEAINGRIGWVRCVSLGSFSPLTDGAATGFFTGWLTFQANRDAVARQIDFFHLALRSQGDRPPG